jgi:hypothetical protein
MEPIFTEGEILRIESVTSNFEEYINQPYIAPKLREQLQRANLLIVPLGLDVSKYSSAPAFPHGTYELFSYLRENAPDGLIPEVCVSDEDYRELDLRAALEIIGAFVVLQVALSVVLGLLTNYISSRFGKRQTDVELEITILATDGSAQRLFYKGPADEFRTRVEPALQALTTEHNDQLLSVSDMPIDDKQRASDDVRVIRG